MTAAEAEDRIELLRRRLAEEVSQSVESSLRRRYSWIGMITAFVLGGLGYGLVENVLRGASDSIVRAELVLDDVEKQLNKVDERTERKLEELDQFVDASSSRLSTLDQRIQTIAAEAEERVQEVDGLLSARQRDLENLGATAARIEDLSAQFAELNSVVSGIAKALGDAAQPDAAPAQYTTALARQTNEIAEIRAQTKEVVQHIKTSRISVYAHVSSDRSSSGQPERVVQQLESLGYTVPSTTVVADVRSLNQVRFYHEEDRPAAEQLAADTAQILEALGADSAAVEARDFTNWQAAKPRRGVVELWL